MSILKNKLIYFSLFFTACAAEEVKVVTNEKEALQIIDTTSISKEISAYKTVLNVVRETELMPDFIFVPGDVDKAKAYISHNQRLLEYNPDFIEKLQQQALNDTNWTGISVLAREISHHLAEHKLEGGKPSREENLEADKNAGFVLYKMGATLEDAVKALEESVKEDTSSQSAVLNVRIAAVTNGWSEAKMLYTPQKEAIVVPEVLGEVKKVEKKQGAVMENTLAQQEKQEFNNGKKVMYKVFIAGDSTIYKVDEADQIFISENSKNKIVGYKMPSTKPGFEWFFEMDNRRYGVDKSGRMWARSLEGEFKVIGQAVTQKF